MQLLRILPVIFIVLLAGCVSQVNNQQQQNEQTSNQSSQQPVETPVQSPAGQGTLQAEVTSPPQQQSQPLPTVKEYTIEITRTGFNPSSLAVKVGDKVTFINQDNAPHWPASAVHPSHCEYKGCGVFDAKKGLSQGESYSIVFDLVGNWKYHDHLNSGTTGNVVVQ